MTKLRLQNVSKSFGGLLAVDGLSVEFEDGRMSALVGPNGAGKTTIFNLIGGLERPSEGDIYYRGQSISNLPPWKIARLGLGRLFQDVRVFDRLTVLENVMVAFRKQDGENPFKSVLMRSLVRREERVFLRRATRLLEAVGMNHQSDQVAINLSYGEQKLLALARLLAGGMDVLLLDEPTAGLSPAAIRKLLALLTSLAEQGKTVVIIEHNMTVVSEFVDQVFLVSKGRVVSSGTAEIVLQSDAVRSAYLGV